MRVRAVFLCFRLKPHESVEVSVEPIWTIFEHSVVAQHMKTGNSVCDVMVWQTGIVVATLHNMKFIFVIIISYRRPNHHTITTWCTVAVASIVVFTSSSNVYCFHRGRKEKSRRVGEKNQGQTYHYVFLEGGLEIAANKWSRNGSIFAFCGEWLPVW